MHAGEGFEEGGSLRRDFRDVAGEFVGAGSVAIASGNDSDLVDFAERLSKSLGDWTQVLESYGENQSQSWQQGGASQSGGQMSRGSSLNYSEGGRALLRPEEILTLNNDYVIVLQRGMAPILANRVKWYEDPDFNPAVARRLKPFLGWDCLRWDSRRWDSLPWGWRLWIAGVVWLILWALANRAIQ